MTSLSSEILPQVVRGSHFKRRVETGTHKGTTGSCRTLLSHSLLAFRHVIFLYLVLFIFVIYFFL